MRLTLDQIASVAWGAVRVAPEDGGVALHRFTEAQEAFYRERDLDLYRKCFATSGMRLVFKTDSTRLSLCVSLSPATSRKYAALEVFADGNRVGSLDNYTGLDMTPDYTVKELPLEPLQGQFDLGLGEKTITVYLPWSLRTVLQSVELDDGASLIPIHREKKLLVFGDSISQGYDALLPSRTYTTQLADFLNAEEINKAIGAEHFVPELAAMREDFDPDYISVAYGTNDWSHRPLADIQRDSRKFYATVSALYPKAKIIALAPIWRKDCDDIRACKFTQLADVLREAAAGLPNITMVDCFDFVPQDERFFADLRLHPNDEGFALYAKNLTAALRKCL